jgi:hypothetical protein
MPIHEFYCSARRAPSNFLSATVDRQRRPLCPHCDATDLERKPTPFATRRSTGESNSEGDRR